MNIRILKFFVFAFIFFFPFHSAFANNLQISNVRVGARDTRARTVSVLFDLSWENSWRNKINHDAAWLTVRLKDAAGAGLESRLCRLSSSGLGSAGNALESYIPDDRNGVFIRRSANSPIGSVQGRDIALTLDYSSCNFLETSVISVVIYGTEMVFVPQGSFYAGDTASLSALRSGLNDSSPWIIGSEAAISVSAVTTGGYFYASQGNNEEFLTASVFTVPVEFPKGYKAFYSMKYEITEGQWVDFINSISAEARRHHDVTDVTHKNSDSVLFRNTISCSGSPLVCISERPARAMSYLSWQDFCAFLDWLALRPMTELEFEKAARGPALPFAGEFAWGSTDIVQAQVIAGHSEEASEEFIVTPDANANFGMPVFSGGDAGLGVDYQRGALRSGIFARENSDRICSGSGSFGLMELSGNVEERVVTLGNIDGLEFTGIEGDGYLTTMAGFEGQADVNHWPGLDENPLKGIRGASGSGFRGGSWRDSSGFLSISDRSRSALIDTQSAAFYGGRGVRSYNGQ